MGIIRKSVNSLVALSLAATAIGTITASGAAAQTGEGNWGAEGRIGSGQSAYLLRWLSPSWSLVIGGGLTATSSESPAVNSKNDMRSVNVSAVVRKEWGAGRVHPMVGFGPFVNASHSKNTSPGSGGITETTSDNNGFGGRFEFGAIAAVNQSVGLGIIAAATGQHVAQKSGVSGGSALSKSTSNGFGVGNPQFVVRVRF